MMRRAIGCVNSGLSMMTTTCGRKATAAATVSCTRRISFGRALLRHFGKIVNQFLLLLPYLLIPFDPRRQGLHDKIANTLVLRL